MPQSERRRPQCHFGPPVRRIAGLLAAGLLLMLPQGCGAPTVDFESEATRLRDVIEEKDRQIAAQQAALAEANRRLQSARALSDEQLAKIFHPEKLVIDALSGGYDADAIPGHDGVVVYLKPVDRDGDALKVAGDIRIELFDLSREPDAARIGVYEFPVDQARELWFGKLLTYHYTLNCAWQQGPPASPDVTIRATFVDYLTQRVITAQRVVSVTLP